MAYIDLNSIVDMIIPQLTNRRHIEAALVQNIEAQWARLSDCLDPRSPFIV